METAVREPPPGACGGPFLIYGLNLTPEPAVRFKPDPDFMDAVNARVLIEVDRNARGDTTSALAGVAPRYEPVPGMADVPVILAPGKFTLEDEDGRPVQVMEWEVLFGSPVAFSVNHRIVLTDPDRPGTKRYLRFVGPTQDDFLMGHHWYGKLREVVRPDE